jgi:hypothetical protein
LIRWFGSHCSIHRILVGVARSGGIERGKTIRGDTTVVESNIHEPSNSALLSDLLGLREGTTENSTVARALLADLVERGLSTDRPPLFVIDGGKGLRKATTSVFGSQALVQRGQVRKQRNVLEHLPERMRPSVREAMQQAYDAEVGDRMPYRWHGGPCVHRRRCGVRARP